MNKVSNRLSFKKPLSFIPDALLLKISFLAFAAIGLVTILQHSMWRDELQAWTIARDSGSPQELYLALTAEGHPLLWHSLLYGLKFIANTPVVMQLLHWLIGVLIIGIFYRFSPFLTLEKILFTFGYFPFYEYYIISRNYSLVFLISIIFCCLYWCKSKNIILVSLCLGLLANSHAFAIPIVIGFICMVSYDWLQNIITKKQDNIPYIFFDKEQIFGVLITIGLIIFSFKTLSAAGDSTPINLLKFDLMYGLKVFCRILGGYTLLIPNSKRWLDLILCSGITFGLVSMVIYSLRQSLAAQIFYASSTLSLLALNYYVYLGQGSRHYGFHYLILVLAMWIYQASKKSTNSLQNQSAKTFPHQLFRFIFTVQLIAGLILFFSHLSTPYSASRVTAQYIKEQQLDTEMIMGNPDTAMTSISGYLDKKIYYPEIQNFGSFAQWSTRRDVTLDDVFREAMQLLSPLNNSQETQRLLLILNQNLEDSTVIIYEQNNLIEIEFIKKFEQSWHSGERYYLYWVKQDK